MPKKSKSQITKKSTTPKKKGTTDRGTSGIKPSFGIIATLLIALFISVTIGVAAVSKLNSATSSLDRAKLAVFDDLAKAYIQDTDVTDNNISEYYQMTGYGISDEDGVFYFTFNFVDPATEDVTIDENGVITAENLRHGIMYFWEDSKRPGHYSHAYSYHDDDYHPTGIYHRIEQ